MLGVAALHGNAVGEDHHGFRRDIIHGGGKFGTDQGAVSVCGGKQRAVFNGFGIPDQGVHQSLIGMLSAFLPGKQGVYVGNKACSAPGMQLRQDLCRWQKRDFFNIFRSALRCGVKIAHGVQFIPEELHTDRSGSAGGIDIQNAATEGKLSGALYKGTSAVAQISQFGNQGVQVIAASYHKIDSRRKQGFFGHGSKTQRLSGCQKHGVALTPQMIEHGKPLMLPATGYSGGAQQCQLPGGEYGGLFPQKAGKLLGHSGGGQIILTDHQNASSGVLMEGRDHVCPVNGAQTRNGAGEIALRQFPQGAIFRQCLQNMTE